MAPPVGDASSAMRSSSCGSSPRKPRSRRARASRSAGASTARSTTQELTATSWALCASSTTSTRRSLPTCLTSTLAGAARSRAARRGSPRGYR
eukprot:8289176-Alexandrium_andersonii.AAC.1